MKPNLTKNHVIFEQGGTHTTKKNKELIEPIDKNKFKVLLEGLGKGNKGRCIPALELQKRMLQSAKMNQKKEGSEKGGADLHQ